MQFSTFSFCSLLLCLATVNNIVNAETANPQLFKLYDAGDNKITIKTLDGKFCISTNAQGQVVAMECEKAGDGKLLVLQEAGGAAVQPPPPSDPSPPPPTTPPPPSDPSPPPPSSPPPSPYDGKCLSNWICKNGDSIMKSIAISWDHNEATASDSCNKWVPECEGNCKATRTTLDTALMPEGSVCLSTWSCYASDGKFVGEPTIWWDHVSSTAAQACNDWEATKTVCNGQCSAVRALRDIDIINQQTGQAPLHPIEYCSSNNIAPDQCHYTLSTSTFVPFALDQYGPYSLTILNQDITFMDFILVYSGEVNCLPLNSHKLSLRMDMSGGDDKELNGSDELIDLDGHGTDELCPGAVRKFRINLDKDRLHAACVTKRYHGKWNKLYDVRSVYFKIRVFDGGDSDLRQYDFCQGFHWP